jgi:alkyldihydroxyacetonephosphate synthase
MQVHCSELRSFGFGSGRVSEDSGIQDHNRFRDQPLRTRQAMKRWNGWGYESIDLAIPSNVSPLLGTLAGPACPRTDATLDQVLTRVEKSRLPSHPLLDRSPETRLRHARGQSLSDWLELRYGSVNSFPDAVAFPTHTEELRQVMELAHQYQASVIPYGGGTSVVGHLTPNSDKSPVLTVSLQRMNALHNLDKADNLATFGAGVAGPDLEASLRGQGYSLGHYPQSFEFSTLGGWVVTRSSGQQSLGFGRIEDMFAGGLLLSPAGDLELPCMPASAAGPDVRQLILGSEARMGILAEATVRVIKQPAMERFAAVLFPAWEPAVEAAIELVRSELCLSMMRVSDPSETVVQLGMAGTNPALKLLPKWPNRCLMLLAFTSDSWLAVQHARLKAWSVGRAHSGLPLPPFIGEKWAEKRFRGAYLRNTLWDLGYAVDTLETGLRWSQLPIAKQRIGRAVSDQLGEHGYVFSHLSHFYSSGCSLYITYLFPLTPDEAEVRDTWVRAKAAASEAIVASGGTISHQHGVGLDHKPYLQAEKGELGLQALRGATLVFDPDERMNPGKLL